MNKTPARQAVGASHHVNRGRPPTASSTEMYPMGGAVVKKFKSSSQAYQAANNE